MKIYIVFAKYNCQTCRNDKTIEKIFKSAKKRDDYLKKREQPYGSYLYYETHEAH